VPGVALRRSRAARLGRALGAAAGPGGGGMKAKEGRSFLTPFAWISEKIAEMPSWRAKRSHDGIRATDRFTATVSHSKVFFASFLFTKKKCLLPLLAFPLLAFPVPALAAGTQSPADVIAAVKQAVAVSLPANAAVTIGSADGAAVMAACSEPLAVSLSGVQPYENAAVRCAAPVWTLYVPVTVMATETVVVAARPVAAGQSLGLADLTLRREPEAAYTGQPVYYDPSALAGAVAMLNLPAGVIITGNDVQAPVLIKAGQTVAVDVHAGGVEVSIDAVALEAGRLGDTIMLTNPSSGRRFNALVTSAGPVVELQP